MKQITEDYVSFEIAQLLKEKGFNWQQSPFYSEQDMDEWRQQCSYTIPNPDFNSDIPFDSETITIVAPHISQSLALKWLREVHRKHICVRMRDFPTQYEIEVYDTKTGYLCHADFEHSFNSYEQAVEAALLYVLKNLI